MTSEELGKMFEGENSASLDGGPSGGSRGRRPGSEDLHWRKQKFNLSFFFFLLLLFKTPEGVVVGFPAWAHR